MKTERGSEGVKKTFSKILSLQISVILDEKSKLIRILSYKIVSYIFNRPSTFQHSGQNLIPPAHSPVLDSLAP